MNLNIASQGQAEPSGQKIPPDVHDFVDSERSYKGVAMWGCVAALVLGTAGAVTWAMKGPVVSSVSPGSIESQEAVLAVGEGGSRSGGDAGSTRIFARVNGKPISESEISGMLGSGIDRAIVVDRYINKVIASEEARRLYPEEADAAIRATNREVLATVYTTRRMQDLREAVTDEQIKDFYEKNVLQENFKQWKVSYYLSTNPADMESTREQILKGDKKALSQLSPLSDQGDGFLAAQAMPYGLGRVVADLKKGELSEVLRLRNGLMVIRVDDFKQLDRPKLKDLEEQIRETLAVQEFNRELEEVRRAAKVELG